MYVISLDYVNEYQQSSEWVYSFTWILLIFLWSYESFCVQVYMCCAHSAYQWGIHRKGILGRHQWNRWSWDCLKPFVGLGQCSNRNINFKKYATNLKHFRRLDFDNALCGYAKSTSQWKSQSCSKQTAEFDANHSWPWNEIFSKELCTVDCYIRLAMVKQ